MQSSQHLPEAISVRDFCARFGVSRSFAYSQIAMGRLLVRKAGRRTLILLADADSWAASLPAGKSRL